MSERPLDEIASPQELLDAISGLRTEQLLRLYQQGNYYALGTEFADGKELLGEAVRRALIGTTGNRQAGERGRPWPKGVDIVGFLMGCMQSIGNGSHHSVAQKAARVAEALVDEDGETNPLLAKHLAFHPGIDDELIAKQDAEARQAIAEADVAEIEKAFADDQEVLGILEGEKDGLPASELREILELNETQYDTARRRMRRKLDKLMPGRKRK